MVDSKREKLGQSWRIMLLLLFFMALLASTVDVEAEVSEAPPEIDIDILLDRGELVFTSVRNGDVTSTLTGPQKVHIYNNGGGTFDWSISYDGDWLYCTPTSGTDNGVVTVSVEPCGLPAGQYDGTIQVITPNGPLYISTSLSVKEPWEDTPPFGGFDTPIDGSTVSGNIPVTGWALDDVSVDNVKIYSGETYLGDATFVEGSRPDVEQTNPTYPRSYQAGWGYMLLTNFLPGGGNGTYTLSAIATDSEGHQTTLGSKTIYCDNANAVKPFGAIDTPAQGGTASGSGFVNWGWALTPPPNTIPTDGSTIDVYVDGVNKGHPVYNMYSGDVAALFPGYNNTSGAAGYFSLDTTGYADGVHTIQWTVTDNANNTDGIGSRYFTIQNQNQSNIKSDRIVEKNQNNAVALDEIPTDYTVPVQYRTGYDEEAPLLDLSPDSTGVVYISIRESDRVEAHLNETGFTGYTQNGDSAIPFLPIGATLDDSGTFYWIPGPGFMGTFELVFIRGQAAKTKKILKLTVRPKHAPFPGIKANGQEGVINISSGTSILLSVSLNSSNYASQGVDWWVATLTPGGQWAHFDLSAGTFVEGLGATHQGPLFDLSDLGLANLTNLSAGTHRFYFGVDMLQNGLPDMDRIYFEGVTVVVAE